jgi:hypothetical protein
MTLLAGVTFWLACGELEELADCRAICDKYQQCIDDDYDVAACTTRCEDESDLDDDYRRQANECEACVNDRACAMTFPCVTECAGIVP